MKLKNKKSRKRTGEIFPVPERISRIGKSFKNKGRTAYSFEI